MIIIGVKLTAVFDSCLSGTILDLPYVYSVINKKAELGGKNILNADFKGDTL